MSIGRLLKFIFIGTPFVVIYFFAALYTIVAMSDVEATEFYRPLLSLGVSLISVVIVTWACGFWGNWKFPLLFIFLPFVVLFDFIVSGAVGLPPMVATLAVVVVYSVLAVSRRPST